MGLWSDLWDIGATCFEAARDIVNAVGSGVGEIIETDGDGLGLGLLSDVGAGIQGLFSDSIASTPSYEKQTASLTTTNDMADRLQQYLNEKEKPAEKIEKACIAALEKQYDNLILLLEDKIQNDREGKASLRKLRRDRKKISGNIEGSIINCLRKRMALSDRECCSILKMEEGTEKKKAMENFCTKIIQEAKEEIAKQASITYEEEIQGIKECLADTQQEREQRINKSKKELEEVEKSMSNRDNNPEQQYVKLKLELGAYQMIEGLLR